MSSSSWRTARAPPRQNFLIPKFQPKLFLLLLLPSEFFFCLTQIGASAKISWAAALSCSSSQKKVGGPVRDFFYSKAFSWRRHSWTLALLPCSTEVALNRLMQYGNRSPKLMNVVNGIVLKKECKQGNPKRKLFFLFCRSKKKFCVYQQHNLFPNKSRHFFLPTYNTKGKKVAWLFFSHFCYIKG